MARSSILDPQSLILMEIDLKNPKHRRGVLREAATLIPNFLKLLYRLFKDPRAPLAEKALLAGTIIYVISPLDFIPDLFPFISQVDDRDLAALVGRVERAARYVLPGRIRRILLGRVEIAPQFEGGLFASPAAPDDIEVERRIRKKI